MAAKKDENETKSEETAPEKASEKAPETAAAPAGDTPQQVAPPKVIVDDSNVNASYANFCRVSSTPEELILDLGLNPHPYATGETTIAVSQRVILNHYTAKRLLSALSMALQRHEQAFGVLETDIRKRVKSNA